MVQKEREIDTQATIATGIDDDEELSRKATEEEIARGDYTRVVSLRYDEDPRLRESE